MDWEAILAITFIFGGGTTFLLSVSPVGRALADRIRGRVAVDNEELADLRDTQAALIEDVEDLRRENVELAERLDFAERLLTRGKSEESA